jgi:ADP-ribose pyrophosphatase YjhB (NUDIX family)
MTEKENQMKLAILREERVWPRNWRDEILMNQVHGRTEIYMYKVKLKCKEPFWRQVPVSSDVVAVVAYDKKEKVYLVRQSRPAWAEKHMGVLVLPGGGVPADLDDDKLACEAKRELKEETGYDCKIDKKLATVLCSGRIRSKQHIFLARVQRRGKPKLEEDEMKLGLQVEPLTLDNAIRKFCNGEEETTGYTVLGLLRAKEELVKEKRVC